jgi:histidine kinase/DNA gyrase B/HSP90-like ATPase
LGIGSAPLDFTQTEQHFLSQTGLLAASSSGMEFVALCELEGERLRCIALSGFEDDANLDAWNLSPIADFALYMEALDGKVAVCNVAPAERASPALAPQDSIVQSHVITPVQIGEQIAGVLTFGARCRFDYTPLEIRGFENIASSIGVALANFRNSRTLAGEVSEYTAAALAITAVEVARVARHEAIGYIDNCNAAAHQLWRKLGAHAVDVEPELEAFSAGLQRVSEALEQIRYAAMPPDPVRSLVRIEQVWNEARIAVAARLAQERIEVRLVGPHAWVEGSPDGLRHVFLNLLLNSMDAFRDGRKAGRRIERTVQPSSERALDTRITYSDNGSGVNSSNLRVPDVCRGKPLSQLLFEPGVTSKGAGSGFGLWLVREILQDHHGSIDLVDHRGGIRFAIRLPTPHNQGAVKEGHDRYS